MVVSKISAIVNLTEIWLIGSLGGEEKPKHCELKFGRLSLISFGLLKKINEACFGVK